MDFFFEQYKYNCEHLLNNISSEFSISKKDLKKFIPKKLSNEQLILLNSIIKKNNYYDNKNNGKKINTKIFIDNKGNKYQIINNLDILEENIYDAFKIN